MECGAVWLGVLHTAVARYSIVYYSTAQKSIGGRLLCASIEGPSSTVTCSIVSYSTVQDSSQTSAPALCLHRRFEHKRSYVYVVV